MNFKKLLLIAMNLALLVALGACAAHSTSPDGINCKPGLPEQDVIPACMGGR